MPRRGGRVTATGRFVRRADGDWLDLAQVSDLMIRPPDWISTRAIRVTGAEVAAAPMTWDGGFMPGWHSVTGVWRDDLIEVETQEPVRRAWHRRVPFAMPAPVGGWDAATQHSRIDGVDGLRAEGAIVLDQWFRHGSGAMLLLVAAADPDRVESALGAQLPRRLCVVRSEYSAAAVHEVETMLHAHAEKWLLESWGPCGMDAWCQPYADAQLTYVGDELADWADTVPPGLLTLEPAMRAAAEA